MEKMVLVNTEAALTKIWFNFSCDETEMIGIFKAGSVNL